MRRILKFLAGLYPAEWRRRYGAEYEALLEEREPQWRDVMDVAWSGLKMRATSRDFVRIVLPCALVGVFATGVMSLISPQQYVSRTTILMRSGVAGIYGGVCGDGADLPTSLRGPSPGLCVYEDDFNRYKQFLDADGFSREFLGSVIEQEGLYQRERRGGSLDGAIVEMKRNIHIRYPSDKSRFVLEFDYPDPRMAQKVDDKLTGQMIVLVQNAEFSRFQETNGEQLQERMKALQESLRLAKSSRETSDLWSEIRQTQVAQVVSMHYRPLTLESLNLRAANLPQRPDGLSRVQLNLVGLLGGLLCGISFATLVSAGKVRSIRPRG
jgi:hypothetical protein